MLAGSHCQLRTVGATALGPVALDLQAVQPGGVAAPPLGRSSEGQCSASRGPKQSRPKCLINQSIQVVQGLAGSQVAAPLQKHLLRGVQALRGTLQRHNSRQVTNDQLEGKP